MKSRDIALTGNLITGSRMAAFALAAYCQNAVMTGNTVDGSNGSRVMSVEKSCEDVNIVYITFRNDDHGSWINQPRNFVLHADNERVNIHDKPVNGILVAEDAAFRPAIYEEYADMCFSSVMSSVPGLATAMSR